MITAIILTHNNQDTILQAVKSVAFCQQLIIIDDHSSDDTRKLLKKTKAKLFTCHLNKDFSAQRNYGLSKATASWVLFIDPDETVSKSLREAILRAVNNQAHYLGFYLLRHDSFLGKTLRHGETGSVKLLRLARKGSGLWHRPVHETWHVSGPTSTLTPPLLHHPHPSLSSFLAKIDYYTSIESHYRHGRGERFHYHTLLLPLGKFIHNYLLKAGFLDGFPGLVMAYFMSLHSLIIRVKLYENQISRLP